MRLLFKGAVYFSGKLADIIDGWNKVCMTDTVTTVSSLCSRSVQPAVETSRATRTALVLAWRPLAAIILTQMCVLLYRLQLLFKGGIYFAESF